jgi:hypothetical protein
MNFTREGLLSCPDHLTYTSVSSGCSKRWRIHFDNLWQWTLFGKGFSPVLIIWLTPVYLLAVRKDEESTSITRFENKSVDLKSGELSYKQVRSMWNYNKIDFIHPVWTVQSLCMNTGKLQRAWSLIGLRQSRPSVARYGVWRH